MTPKQYLMQYRALNHRIDSLLYEHDRIKNICASVQAMDYTRDRVQASYVGSRVESTVCKLIDLEDQINSNIDMLILLRDEICTVIESVQGGASKAVLRMRYVNGLTWSRIAEALSYTEMQIYRLHGRALQQITLPKDVREC